MLTFEEVEVIASKYLDDVLNNVQFSACQALDIRFGTRSNSRSITRSLTHDGAEYVSSAIHCSANIFGMRTCSYTESIVDETMLCLASSTTIKGGVHIIITVRYKAGMIETAKEEFRNAIGIFNGRHNPNYK